MNRLTTLLGSMALLTLVAAGCGGAAAPAPAGASGPKPAATPPPQKAQAPAAAAYEAITVSSGAAIAGVVSFSGTPPKPETLAVDKDKEICGDSKPSEKLIVSSAGGIKSAVVSIKGIAKGKAMTFPGTVTLDQKDCLYTPHMLIGRVGGNLDVRNGDPMMHNVHSFPFDNPSINRAQPKGSQPIAAALKLPEIYKVGCDIHKWMSAWVVAAEHPYYVITGDDGSYQVTEVPPGTYTVEVWHEALGTSTQEVTVKAGETAQVSFKLAPR